MHVADDAFVSLPDLLRPPHLERDADPVVDASHEAPPEVPAPSGEHTPEAIAAIARDVRLFRARLADAFDAARDALLRDFAYAVLGRELVLAAPDIATIAARVLAEHPLAQPLRLRIAPDDIFAIDARADALPPAVCDPALAPGDVMIELAFGAIDARLGVRLAEVLEQTA